MKSSEALLGTSPNIIMASFEDRIQQYPDPPREQIKGPQKRLAKTKETLV